MVKEQLIYIDNKPVAIIIGLEEYKRLKELEAEEESALVQIAEKIDAKKEPTITHKELMKEIGF
jgi:PHD/YefM family antitoxin component YafN of YafNO toxin-antitoxin module